MEAENKKSDSEKKIELHHEAIREIMGTPPAIMVRAGSGVLLVVVLCLFIGARFISYPDIVEASAYLYGDFPHAILTVPESGRVVHFFSSPTPSTYPSVINDGDTVLQIEKNDGEKISILSDTFGFLELDPILNVKTYVQKNDTIAIIWGKGSESVACIVRISPEQAKNVKEGNRVRLHLDKYPSEKYGIVEAKVISISSFNTQRDIRVIAELPRKIKTTNLQEIFIMGNIYGTAEIITGEKTMFDRLVNPFRGLAKP